MYNNDNKKEWADAQMQIVNFSFNDVIATSDGDGLESENGGWG